MGSKSRRAFATAVLCVTGVALAQAPAAPQQPSPGLPRVTVRCVDADGKPVANAEVHVLQNRKTPNGPADYVVSGPHRTDESGVAVTAIAIDYDGGRFDRWFHARVPGKLVGALRSLRMDGPPPPAPEIRMQPSRELHGCVHVPDGVAPQAVRVRMLSLSVLGGTEQFGTPPFPRVDSLPGLRTTLPALFDADVAGDGTFVLRDIPGQARIYLAAEGAGLAQAQWFNAMLPERRIPDLIDFAMVPESAIEGVATGPDGKPLVDGAVAVGLHEVGPQFGVHCTFATRTDAQGRFRIGGLPSGEVSLEVTHAAGVMRPQLHKMAPSETARGVEVKLEAGIEVRGVVRSATDGAGVEGCGLVAVTDDGRQWRLGYARTDPQGRFLLRLPQGPAMLYLGFVPSSHVLPDPRLDKQLRVEVQPGNASLGAIVFEVNRTQ